MINKKLITDVYSTNEVKTNKVYIDENGIEWPVYRKIVNGTLPSQNFTKFIDMSFANEIIGEDIRIKDGSSTIKMPFVNLVNDYYLDFYIDSSNNYYIHFSANAYGSKPFKAIIEYTKTTN